MNLSYNKIAEVASSRVEYAPGGGDIIEQLCPRFRPQSHLRSSCIPSLVGIVLHWYAVHFRLHSADERRFLCRGYISSGSCVAWECTYLGQPSDSELVCASSAPFSSDSASGPACHQPEIVDTQANPFR